MTLTHADMVKLEKHRGLVAMLPRYDKPLRGPGKRIREGDRGIRPGAMVSFENATTGLPVYGTRSDHSGYGQVWSQSPQSGYWYVVTDDQVEHHVHKRDMAVVQGVGEQMTLADA